MSQAEHVEAGRSFGKLVTEKGLATPDEVERCLKIQIKNSHSGVFIRLGEILVAEGLLSTEQVQELLALQQVKILICAKCLTKYNVEGWKAGSAARCKRCGAALVEPSQLSSLSVEDQIGDESPGVTEIGIMGHDSRVFGAYEILGEISRGGMGIVYKARQHELGRIVALKILLAGGESLDQDIQRFQREARAVARLSHPNIVGIHEIGELRGIHFFSMNYIQGYSLDKLIRDPETDRRQLLDILCTVVEAVEYSHIEGVLHRDLKPSNILVTKAREPYLIDFGIAKFLGGGSSQLTKEGFLFGSPLYMAPEYVAGKVPQYDERCDTYALGVILYKMLTRQTPYEDDETLQILRRILHEQPVPVERLAHSGLDKDLATICNKAIEREPHRRYQSPRELGEDIRRYLRGQEIKARPRSIWHRIWAKVRTKGYLLTVLLLCLILLVGAFSMVDRGSRIDDLTTELGSLQQSGVTQQGDLRQLLRELDELGSRHPRSSRVCLLRARVLRMLGHLDKAREAEKAAKRLETAK